MALIVTFPLDTPIIFPFFTFAILSSDEDHLTFNDLLPYFLTDTSFLSFAVISSSDLLKTGAFTTLTLQVYFLPSFFHLTLDFPAFFAVITPFFVTDTTAFFDALYFPLFSFSPSISRLSLSPFEIIHSDTDSFTAACRCSGTDGTAMATATAAATLFNKCFFIWLPPKICIF